MQWRFATRQGKYIFVQGQGIWKSVEKNCREISGGNEILDLHHTCFGESFEMKCLWYGRFAVIIQFLREISGNSICRRQRSKSEVIISN